MSNQHLELEGFAVRTAGCLVAMLALMAVPALGRGPSKDLGGGFKDHGVASPISNHRGFAATVDGDGHNVIVLWLMDHRGGYALLMADAQTGKAEQFPMPFDSGGDSPYASILSSANRFYTHFGNHFVEFDPAKRAFTFHSKTAPQMAMSMAEDDNGVIWSVTYPDSGVVSYDPKTGKFRDYGHVYKQDWKQYPRYIAADDAGWIYFGLGNTFTQIVALDPESGKATPVLKEEQRKKGIAFVYRDLDGKVYGQSLRDDKEDWYELYKGKARNLGPGERRMQPKPVISGSQGLSHNTFPDGGKGTVNLVDRKFTVETADGQKKEFDIDYTSEGALVMGCATSPDGTIRGGTAFPMRSFRYDPKTDELTDVAAYMQWNTTAVQGKKFMVGGYPGGFLLEYDPFKPWVPTTKKPPGGNPLFLTDCDPDLHRPTTLFPHPDGHTMILAGTPDYGYTGGGLLFWDLSKEGDAARTLLTDQQLIPDQSTESIVALPSTGKPGEKLLCATTTAPGTGGQKKAKQAEMYVMDFASRKIEWREPVIPGVQEYTALWPGPRGLIYGVADSKTFFVFDPASRKVTHQFDTSKDFGPVANQQGPRPFMTTPEGRTLLLVRKGLAEINPESHKLTLIAKSPVDVWHGGDYHDGRVYFIHGSHLMSCEVPAAK